MIKKFAVIAIVCFWLAACGGRPDPPNDVRSGPAPEQPASGKPYKTVEIDSLDGTPIYGSMYAADKPNSPALLLLHQWQSDRHSFDDFSVKMQQRGFAVLAIDGRGFGESNRHSNGSRLEAGRTDADVKGMLGDVDAAFSYLSKQANVDPARVGIVGASYGSSLAIIYAADHPNVAAVALLSPGLNYFGNMPIEPAISKFGDRPLYMLAGQEKDKESYDAVKKLDVSVDGRSKYESTIHPDGEHGTELLRVGAADELLDFFTRKLTSK